MLDICLLGTGGMMPLPGRWLTSMMVRYKGSSILIDCGEGTQVAIREKGWSFHDIDIICFTHYHGDHIAGLPGLLLSMGNAERTAPLTMVGPRGLERVVSALRIIAPDLPFELKFVEISQPSSELQFGELFIDTFRVSHSVVCYGYSIRVKRGGKFYPEKAQEQNIPVSCWNRLQHGQTVEENGITYTPDMVIGPERKGFKVTYVTDTRPIKEIETFAKDSDLFICEGLYGEREKQIKCAEHKHMSFREAAKLAKNANVRELWLTHYSPAMLRPELFINEARSVFPNTKLGRDGRTKIMEFNSEED